MFLNSQAALTFCGLSICKLDSRKTQVTLDFKAYDDGWASGGSCLLENHWPCWYLADRSTHFIASEKSTAKHLLLWVSIFTELNCLCCLTFERKSTSIKGLYLQWLLWLSGRLVEAGLAKIWPIWYYKICLVLWTFPYK